MSGKHIELFLVDGVPGGITTAEIAGWTGHVLIGPRSDLGEILKRDEAKRNGAYLLLGDGDDTLGVLDCYIGRTESFRSRIQIHDKAKDFWRRIVVISAKDDSFTEGHWGYLEARLVEIAKESGRATLLNSNAPQERKLSEAQRSDMEAFIAQLQIVLPVLGVNVIRVRQAVQPSSAATEPSPTFKLIDAKKGVDATAQVIGDEFTVLAGSTIVGTWAAEGKATSTQRAYASYRAQHELLVKNGSVVIEGGIGRLTRDLPFGSPSQAGAVALGRSCNGRIEWKTPQWGTYGNWEDRGTEGFGN